MLHFRRASIAALRAQRQAPHMMTLLCRDITVSALRVELAALNQKFILSRDPEQRRSGALLLERELLEHDVTPAADSATLNPPPSSHPAPAPAAVDSSTNSGLVVDGPPHCGLTTSDVTLVLMAAATFQPRLTEPCHAVDRAFAWCMEPRRAPATIVPDVSAIDNLQMAPAWRPQQPTGATATKPTTTSVLDDAAAHYFLAPAQCIDARSAASILQSLLQISHPQLLDLIVAWVPLLCELAPSMDLVSLIMLVNVLGRTGTHHRGLVRLLARRMAGSLKSAGTCTIAQTANALFAFAHAGCEDTELFGLLAASALRLLPEASVLVIATVLDAARVARFGEQFPDDMVAAYARAGAGAIAECQPAVLAAMLTAASKLLALKTPGGTPTLGAAARAAVGQLMTAGTARAAATATAFEAPYLAKAMVALSANGCSDEGALGALAERATRIVSTCRMDDAARFLDSLASLELYDDELFSGLANRAIALLRGGSNVRGPARGGQSQHAARMGAIAAEDVATILISFAAVSQPHPDLFAVGAAALRYGGLSLPTPKLVAVLWAFVVLAEHRRHEATFTVLQAELRRRLELLSPAARAKLQAEVTQPKLAAALVTLKGTTGL